MAMNREIDLLIVSIMLKKINFEIINNKISRYRQSKQFIIKLIIQSNKYDLVKIICKYVPRNI